MINATDRVSREGAPIVRERGAHNGAMSFQ